MNSPTLLDIVLWDAYKKNKVIDTKLHTIVIND